MIAYIFPGQGSQRKGMGGFLFDEFYELTNTASELVGYSIKELCLEDPSGNLSKTQFTQPALFVVNALTYLHNQQTGKPVANFVAGHSLGEYDALFAAEALTFETGLLLVKRRGELMSQARDGGMAAVIGLDETKIKETLLASGFHSVDIANLNSPSQSVISGPKADIEKLKPVFEESGCMSYIILNVSGAFHSSLMTEAREKFIQYLDTFSFSTPKIPVIANVSARPYRGNELKKMLADQITHPVKWSESIRYLLGKGVDQFEEVGPGNVLSGLINRIKRESKPLIIQEEPVEIETLTNTYGGNTSELLTASSQNTHKIDQLGKSSGNGYNKLSRASVENNVNQILEEELTFSEETHLATASPFTEQFASKAASLGSANYKKAYRVKYAYAAGGMYKGIASSRLVVAMSKAGMMSYYGTGGVDIETIEKEIINIKTQLNEGAPFGMNIIHDLNNPENEKRIIDLYLRHEIKNIEASAFMQITAPIVKFRLKGLKKGAHNEVISVHRIQAKISRPEIAELFLSPPPERILQKLLASSEITTEEAALGRTVPVATDLCVEADSGGHTDQGIATVLIPAIKRLKNELTEKFAYKEYINLGAAGGIGTPESAACAFLLGADYIVTGSINQCTVEAGISDSVKDMLEVMNVQDTTYAPAGDMFELGAKIQVLSKGVFFPARANKLYDIYKHHESLDELDDKTKNQLEEKYFKRTFIEIFEECKKYYQADEIEKANRSPKHKMAMTFKWYYAQTTKAAIAGTESEKINYQVHCGPSLGAFNQWTKGTELEKWRNRNVDKIGITLLSKTSDYLINFCRSASSS